MENIQIKRVQNISISEHNAQPLREHVELLDEYLRNVVRFISASGLDEGQPIFDAAESIAPNLIKLDPSTEESLKKIQGSSSGLMAAICRCHLKWTVLLDFEQRPSFVDDFSGLYEPLMKIIEDGVAIQGIRKGDLILGQEGFAMPLGGWKIRHSA